MEIDQVNILITCNALINSIGNKTLCVEAKKFLRYCAYSLNRPIPNLVPRAHDPFGLRQGSRALANRISRPTPIGC